jgi:hypothetical protein
MKRESINIIWSLRDIEVSSLRDLYKQEMTPQLREDLEAISQKLAGYWIDIAQDYLNRQKGMTYEQKLEIMYAWRDSLKKG